MGVPIGIFQSGTVAQILKPLPKNPAILAYYVRFGDPAPGVFIRDTLTEKIVPMITWEPYSGLSQITNGSKDAYIKKFALTLKDYKKPIYLRFAHEMNGNWYPWSTNDYVDAWIAVKTLFNTAGATNVKFVWCPNIEYTGSKKLSTFYPGHSYVDVVGLDGYNFGKPWTSFEDLYAATITKVNTLSNNKSIIICETSSTDKGKRDKGDWIEDAFNYINGMSNIEAVVWFNDKKEADWSFDSTPFAKRQFEIELKAGGKFGIG